jgi:hypothetical protein
MTLRFLPAFTFSTTIAAASGAHTCVLCSAALAAAAAAAASKLTMPQPLLCLAPANALCAWGGAARNSQASAAGGGRRVLCALGCAVAIASKPTSTHLNRLRLVTRPKRANRASSSSCDVVVGTRAKNSSQLVASALLSPLAHLALPPLVLRPTCAGVGCARPGVRRTSVSCTRRQDADGTRQHPARRLVLCGYAAHALRSSAAAVCLYTHLHHAPAAPAGPPGQTVCHRRCLRAPDRCRPCSLASPRPPSSAKICSPAACRTRRSATQLRCPGAVQANKDAGAGAAAGREVQMQRNRSRTNLRSLARKTVLRLSKGGAAVCVGPLLSTRRGRDVGATASAWA